MYLIDTNHCSLAILGNVNILSRLAEVENSLVSTCVIVQGELIDMAARSQKQQINLALVQNFLRGIYIYNIDRQTAIAVLGLVRYKNPTPNPLPACEEGAKMYLM